MNLKILSLFQAGMISGPPLNHPMWFWVPCSLANVVWQLQHHHTHLLKTHISVISVLSVPLKQLWELQETGGFILHAVHDGKDVDGKDKSSHTGTEHCTPCTAVHAGH